MLRERPFDIYAGQEDDFGPGYFSRHNPVFLFAYNRKRTIAFHLSWIFFSEKKMMDLPGFFFSEKLPSLPINTKWSLPDFSL